MWQLAREVKKMPNGKPGDAPWTDFFVHKMNVFPPDISDMLWAIYRVSPDLIKSLNYPDMWNWEKGEKLDDARLTLKKIISENGIQLKS